MLRLRFSLCALACALVFSACSGNAANAPSAAPVYNARALPSGPVGASIALGRDIMDHTQARLPRNVTASMSCSACHLAGGTVKRGGSFIGLYGRFPQWNARAKRTIALQDRIAECFLYSMNGTPPAYSSKEMVALVAYIAYLSRNVPVGTPQASDDRFVVAKPASPPNIAHGSALYTQKCSVCHGSGGAGVAGSFPPLWGATSFNNGAGMAHINRMAGFIRYNMPQNAPGSLSMNDSYDVAAFVLSHARPRFEKNRMVVTPPIKASYF